MRYQIYLTYATRVLAVVDSLQKQRTTADYYQTLYEVGIKDFNHYKYMFDKLAPLNPNKECHKDENSLMGCPVLCPHIFEHRHGYMITTVNSNKPLLITCIQRLPRE